MGAANFARAGGYIRRCFSLMPAAAFRGTIMEMHFRRYLCRAMKRSAMPCTRNAGLATRKINSLIGGYDYRRASFERAASRASAMRDDAGRDAAYFARAPEYAFGKYMFSRELAARAAGTRVR